MKNKLGNGEFKDLAREDKFEVLDLVTKEDLLKKIDQLNTQIEEYDSEIFAMRTLLQLGKSLGDILNLTELLSGLMAVARDKYGVVNSTVLILDEETDPAVFRLHSFYGLPEEIYWQERRQDTHNFHFPKSQGLLWNILRQGEAFSVLDSRRRPRFAESWKRWELGVINSHIWCPLIKKGEVFGILTLGPKNDGDQIQRKDFSFLQDLSSIAVTNIDSVMKYEKNETILRNVKILYNVNQQLAEVQNFKSLCLESLKAAVLSMKAETGNLMLWNEETQSLEIKVIWGVHLSPSEAEKLNKGDSSLREFKLGEGVAGRCALLRKTIRENDPTRIDQTSGRKIYSLICVPLIRGQEVVGVLSMTNKVKKINSEFITDPRGRFDQDDETLLIGLADNTASNLHRSKLYNASITDQMTGLYNSPHFDYELDKALHDCLAQDKPVCLAIIDIDHFKQFNDSFGHQAGDEVLITVGNRIKELLWEQKGHKAFRYGGDEFCWLMPETAVEESLILLERLRLKMLKQLPVFNGNKLKVGLSIGVSWAPGHGKIGRDIFQKADKALYSSKAKGRNQITLFEASAMSEAPSENTKESIKENKEMTTETEKK